MDKKNTFLLKKGAALIGAVMLTCALNCFPASAMPAGYTEKTAVQAEAACDTLAELPKTDEHAYTSMVYEQAPSQIPEPVEKEQAPFLQKYGRMLFFAGIGIAAGFASYFVGKFRNRGRKTKFK